DATLRVGNRTFEFDADHCDITGRGRLELGSFPVEGQFANVIFDDGVLNVILEDGRIFLGESTQRAANSASGRLHDLSVAVALTSEELASGKMLELPAWPWELS